MSIYCCKRERERECSAYLVVPSLETNLNQENEYREESDLSGTQAGNLELLLVIIQIVFP